MSAESTTRSVSLVKNTLIIAFGKLSTQFLTFLLLPLYTTYLATSEFGTVDLVMTYVTLLAPIITVSLEMGVFRFLIDVRSDEERQKRIISTVVRFTACEYPIRIVCTRCNGSSDCVKHVFADCAWFWR